jgi:hypothetical protein
VALEAPEPAKEALLGAAEPIEVVRIMTRFRGAAGAFSVLVALPPTSALGGRPDALSSAPSSSSSASAGISGTTRTLRAPSSIVPLSFCYLCPPPSQLSPLFRYAERVSL